VTNAHGELADGPVGLHASVGLDDLLQALALLSLSGTSLHEETSMIIELRR